MMASSPRSLPPALSLALLTFSVMVMAIPAAPAALSSTHLRSAGFSLCGQETSSIFPSFSASASREVGKERVRRILGLDMA